MNIHAQNAKLFAAAKKPKGWVLSSTRAIPATAAPTEGATARRIRKA